MSADVAPSAGLLDADIVAIGAAIGRKPVLVAPERTRTREVLALAIDVLRLLDDPIAINAVDVLASELAEVADRLATYQLILSETLTLAHGQHVEISRLRARLADLLQLARGPQ